MRAGRGILRVKPLLKLGKRERREFGAEGGIGGGQLGESVREGLDVEAGAADEDGKFAAGGNLRDFLVSQTDKLGSIEVFGNR